MLFNPDETKRVKALSVGFGVFMGIVPIWGLQMATAIALAFLFRLNKSLVLIAANISVPPMIPFILYLSHLSGGIWLGKNAVSISFEKGFSLEVLQDSLLQYALGAFTLAIVAGFLFGLLSYALLLIFKRPAFPVDDK